MTRKYVIMCDTYDEENQFTATDPVDVVSTMTQAEEVCFNLEADDPDGIYYWREVISSED